MAKRKRKNDEYYFDVFLACGTETGDYFEKLFEIHDYFINLERGQSIQVSAQSLSASCRFTIGIYDSDHQPLDVQIVAPDATAIVKNVPTQGEYILRLRCETENTGAYQIIVSCNAVQSFWQKTKQQVLAFFEGRTSPPSKKKK